MTRRARTHSLAAALSATALALGTLASVPAAATPMGAPQAQNPCAPAKKKATNPCAPAAKKPTNPCAPAAKKPTNPCAPAAKKKCEDKPANPCAPKAKCDKA